MGWITVDGFKLDVEKVNRDERDRAMKVRVYCDGFTADFVRMDARPRLVCKFMEGKTMAIGGINIPDPVYNMMLKVVYGIMYPAKRAARPRSSKQLELFQQGGAQ